MGTMSVTNVGAELSTKLDSYRKKHPKSELLRGVKSNRVVDRILTEYYVQFLRETCSLSDLNAVKESVELPKRVRTAAESILESALESALEKKYMC